MNGRIENLGTETGAGSIKAENGVIASFDASDVWPRGVKGLAVGQLVSFDLKKGDSWTAVNVSVEKQYYASHPAEKTQRTVRYLGFRQNGNVRVYRYQKLSPDGTTQTATVSIDLALFTKHHVGIQDGPTLCMQLVRADLEDETEKPPALQRSLTDQDMLAHVARRAPGAKKRLGGRRRPPNPNVGKHWRGTGPRRPPNS